jgi:hypothetical protein
MECRFCLKINGTNVPSQAGLNTGRIRMPILSTAESQSMRLVIIETPSSREKQAMVEGTIDFP